MILQSNNALFRRLLKSILIGPAIILMHSLPLSAKPSCISAHMMQTTIASGSIASNVSLISGAYFLLLLGVGFALSRYYLIRKNKNEENAD